MRIPRIHVINGNDHSRLAPSHPTASSGTFCCLRRLPRRVGRVSGRSRLYPSPEPRSLWDRKWRDLGGILWQFLRRPGSPDFQFRLLSSHCTTLFLLEDELSYFTENGLWPQTNWGAPKRMALNIVPGLEAAVMLVQCQWEGKCHGNATRPLHCRLYPFIPVLSPDGVLLRIEPASVFDLTDETMGFRSPCTVLTQKQAYFDRWKNDSRTLEFLRNPTYHFSFGMLRNHGRFIPRISSAKPASFRKIRHGFLEVLGNRIPRRKLV